MPSHMLLLSKPRRTISGRGRGYGLKIEKPASFFGYNRLKFMTICDFPSLAVKILLLLFIYFITY